MYAIIATGGKQYRVKKGDVIEVELLGDVDPQAVQFSEILFLHDGSDSHLGAPFVKGFVVKGELLGSVKGPKLKAMKYKKRKQEYRTFGHRQHYSQVKVLDIAKV
jgi:large subunit ribosomal protein L21